jgi:hypothetical protein
MYRIGSQMKEPLIGGPPGGVTGVLTGSFELPRP